MESFKRIKRINNKDYVYEVQPYYDNELKKIRQKSKYIGIYNGDIDNAKPLRKREAKASYAYGEFILIEKILSDTGLSEILKEILIKKDFETVLTLAINKVVNPQPMHAIHLWYEDTVISRTYPEAIVESRALSKFLKKIGNEKNRQSLFKKIIEKNNVGNVLFYDITSITSYSEFIQLLEYGYNRNNDGLKQVNFALVIDKKNNLPILYDVYAGSIVDTNTIQNLLKKLNSYGIKESVLILDRGFFSKTNIKDLMKSDSKTDFIIPASLNTNTVCECIENEDIENIKYLNKYNLKPIFSKPVKIKIDKHDLKGYLYFNTERANSEKQNFYTKLFDIKKLIDEKIKNISEEIEIQNILNDIGVKFKKFFIYNQEKNEIEYNENNINNELKYCGKFILLYGDKEYNWTECLETYNQKISIEESFNLLKNDMECSRLNMKTEESFQGLLFIHFISLIIKMKLKEVLKNAQLDKKYTLNMLLMELHKIKKIELDNGEIIMTILTKKQKEILKALSVCA